MKMVTLLLVLAVALASCTNRGRPASPSQYDSLRFPWQKRADPPAVTPIPDPAPISARQPRYPAPAEGPEAPPISAPRESVVSEPAPPPPKRS